MTPRSRQVLALQQSGALLGCSGQAGTECDPVPLRAPRASRSCQGEGYRQPQSTWLLSGQRHLSDLELAKAASPLFTSRWPRTH